MKILALDVGTKRIGVARADTDTRIAIPQCTINVDGSEFDQIARLSRVYKTTLFVIGLPRNSKGEETAQSGYCRTFAKKLKSKLKDVKIAFQDESLTSVEAENRLKSRKKSYEKSEIDAEAAAIILQDFLENFKKGTKASESKVMPKVQHKKKLSKTIKTLLFVLAGIFVLAVGVFAIIFTSSLKPVGPSIDCENVAATPETREACEYKTLTIEEGSSVKDISASLKNKDIIRNEFFFKLYLKLNGLGSSLKAGRYNVNKQMSVSDLASLLSDPSAGTVTFRITTIPGGTLKDFKQTLILNGYTEDEIDDALSVEYDHPVLASKPKDASLEGYIFGETIEYVKGATVTEIVEKYLDALYEVVISNKLEEKFSARGLSLHEGIILASVIQKEAANQEDMSMIAGIFYNRLAIGQHLGSDSTIKYYLDQVDPDRKTHVDNTSILTLDSCYNTSEAYGVAGLPCGAISNPGVTALRSAATPSETDYLYFLTGDDGKMYYSTTADGHQANRATYCKVYCDTSL